MHQIVQELEKEHEAQAGPFSSQLRLVVVLTKEDHRVYAASEATIEPSTTLAQKSGDLVRHVGAAEHGGVVVDMEEVVLFAHEQGGD